MTLATVRVDWTPLIEETERLEVALNVIEKGDVYQEDLQDIADFMVKTAQGFIDRNGTIKTRRMRDLMQAQVSKKQIRLWNDARNPITGYPYPRAIEYGYVHYKHGYIPARPFLRPTLRLASELSKNKLEDTTLNVLQGKSLNKAGRRARLDFGTNLSQNASAGQAGRGMSRMSSAWSNDGTSAWDIKR
jgi:hypothetical protein